MPTQTNQNNKKKNENQLTKQESKKKKKREPKTIEKMERRRNRKMRYLKGLLLCHTFFFLRLILHCFVNPFRQIVARSLLLMCVDLVSDSRVILTSSVYRVIDVHRVDFVSFFIFVRSFSFVSGTADAIEYNECIRRSSKRV